MVDKYLEDSSDAYAKLTDEELILLSRQNNSLASEYLILKYKNLVRAKARPYFLMGADREDIVQEGMIGLYKAIRDYKVGKPSSFRSFAEICITRQIITAIKAATRYKHVPLNSYISLNSPVFEKDDKRTIEDVMGSDTICDPEEIFIIKEDFSRVENQLYKHLSSFEYKVFESYLCGSSYQEIAKELGKSMKSVDNALQRIKKKLEKCLQKDS